MSILGPCGFLHKSKSQYLSDLSQHIYFATLCVFCPSKLFHLYNLYQAPLASNSVVLFLSSSLDPQAYKCGMNSSLDEGCLHYYHTIPSGLVIPTRSPFLVGSLSSALHQLCQSTLLSNPLLHSLIILVHR